ncbi:MAG: TPM domain-containing protein [Wolinella sp.]
MHSLLYKAWGIFLLLLLSHASLFATSHTYVNNQDSQLVKKSEIFATLLANELYQKTGISLYLIALDSLKGQDVSTYKATLLPTLRQPYVLVLFAKQEKKIDIVASEESEKLFDKKDVYWNYIVPLIPKKDAELAPPNISAMLLNGYVQIADSIALSLDVKLEHTFAPEDKGTRTFVRITLYAMLFILLLLFLFRFTRRK